jgi:hypothetical protein
MVCIVRLDLIYARSLTLPIRWYFQLLLTTHHLIRLHCRRVSSLRHSWWRSRGDRTYPLRLPRRQVRQPSLDLDLRTLDLYSGHALDRLSASSKQHRSLVWILSHTSFTNPICRSAQSYLYERGWVHEEDNCSSNLLDWLLHWQHHWPSNLPPEGCSKIYPCRNRHCKLLYSISTFGH